MNTMPIRERIAYSAFFLTIVMVLTIAFIR